MTGDYYDRKIFERDGWVCHICGDPIDPNLPRTHRMGATIDHVLPIALGGVDSSLNVAAAHWACNRDKSDSTPL